MEIVIRKAAAPDFPILPSIFRDANDTLRASRGGLTPDSEIDRMNAATDAELQRMLCRDSVIFVAEIRETGQLAGMGALTDNLVSRIVGSTYSRNHYVRSSFQGGKAGVSFGRLLREATIAESKRLGFRKMFGYSTPEAVGFHKKFGAVFHPRHNAYLTKSTLFNYYEIELRKSVLNGLHVEPYMHRAGMLLGAALKLIRRRKTPER